MEDDEANAEAMYHVALKRERRAAVPKDWPQRLEAIAGVRVLGRSATRAQFMATKAALQAVRNSLGDDFHIEPSVSRDTQRR